MSIPAFSAIVERDGTVQSLRVLRLRAVCERTGLSRATLYNYVKAGTFPKAISLGEQAVGWLEHEVDGWILCRPRADRVSAAGVGIRRVSTASTADDDEPK